MTVTPIVALDVATRGAAMAIVDRLGDRCGFYKVGSELFTAVGPSIVGDVRGRGKRVFVDLKFHDIPNTVRAAVANAARIGASLVTVHASGGRAMLEAAAEGAADSPAGEGCTVLAVSVLTSLDARSVGEAWGREGVDVDTEVVRLARLAGVAGVGGIVCSAHEATPVRRAMGEAFDLLVPGIRLSGGDAHDQARVATPAVAIAAGATYLVLGRAVTGDRDPAGAMARVAAEIDSAVAARGPRT